MKITDWQAIIFDFDGVVAESGKIKTQAFANLYHAYGEDVVAAVVQYHNQHGGMSRYRKFQYFQQHLLAKPALTVDEEKELDQRFSELVVEAVIASNAVPGANELIRQQAARIPLFVASGTPETELKVIVERRGLTPYFAEVRGAPTLKQTLIAEILFKHQLLADSVLMIGDALVDYESAHANGVAFLGRVYPGDPNPFPAHVQVVPDLRALVI
ncbi:MAG: HAD hydrolase-like protein [Nitrosomonas sp.]|nr:HAD hydrolase-like protein [Nitrosomonas sp.]MDP1951788.1 HAD hydrolase-like protein [Nitrosomonas sp.]